MAVLTCSFHSEYVGYETMFTIILPQEKHIRSAASAQMQLHSFKKEYPVLFLLHDETEGREEWLHMTSLCRYAQETGIAVVLPEGHRSFYSDYAGRDGNSGENDTGIQLLQKFSELMYETFITEELVEYVRTMFPISSDRSKTWIGGKSMGGFGALKLGLNHPELFGSVFSISGLMDLQWGMDNLEEKKEQFEAIFGGLQVPGCGADDFSHTAIVLAQQKKLPRLRIISNRNSLYEKSNFIFSEKVRTISDRITWELDEPELTWEYLDGKTKELSSWLISG